jgi:hypothetical protein
MKMSKTKKTKLPPKSVSLRTLQGYDLIAILDALTRSTLLSEQDREASEKLFDTLCHERLYIIARSKNCCFHRDVLIEEELDKLRDDGVIIHVR